MAVVMDPEIFGKLQIAPWDLGCGSPTRNTSLSHICHHVEFGRSKSDCTSLRTFAGIGNL